MSKPVRCFGILTLVQLLVWAGFTGLDVLDETWLHSTDLFAVYFFAAPILISLLYLRYRPRLHTEQWKSWQNTLFCLGIWILETAAIGFPVGYLVNYNRWIVPQATGGWENFLNGIEYLMFPFFCAGIPLIIIVLWTLGEWIYRNIRKS